MLYGFLAYLLWGLFPAYFPLLLPAAPLEIIAHRIIWTGVVMALAITATKKWRELRDASLATWLRIAIAAILIAANWLIYVIAVNSQHVADAALGYFINPLVSVLLGVVFLAERLRKLQTLSVIVATIAVLLLSIVGGHVPVISLLLAASFGFYGLVKKGLPLSPSASLAAETLILMPVALVYVVYLESTGVGTFFSHGSAHSALLISAGLVTAIPLLLFGIAAKLIPLSTIGMLQYMTPTFQMLWAVFVVNEQLDTIRWVGFVIIWISVGIYLTDLALWRKKAKKISAPHSSQD
ncbi:EamA family transporter RarD [Corynebacterium pseudotuberculosis]|uniref:EamA family transporter RarD n=1 Tax=Corynebacterium pseudotuberculosis (strain C231) TaxID=681645 RepID=D9QBB8_CORP2|nr:EamA family transporter RarD [Corynebacterium pseudotuberculosis]ADK29173.1 EamA family transporter RarD [Corynebacterium pseudotuberculosis FRC41]ADL10844.1 EamA family transporter RarD [Corynebacterium pseudotuberculosis C231]ADL21251.1 EamA family transporter RarD [Corynebacterium pseudotuberculosis 1002]AEK92705.1 RarD protein [Corynebacterium pseudotuberculosis PAT10]AEP70613.1 RarD protein [Corynebacterium pseudotuberculosis 42/02-A]